MRLPAYGGSLFDPARFPFLTATDRPRHAGGHVSRPGDAARPALGPAGRAQGGEARRISFRDIDVEQIGYIYEGLLGYTARHRRRDSSRPAWAHAARNPRSRCRCWKSLPQANTRPEEARRGDPRLGRGGPAAAKPQSAAAIAKGDRCRRRAECGQRAGAGRRRRRRTA